MITIASVPIMVIVRLSEAGRRALSQAPPVYSPLAVCSRCQS